MKLQRWAAVLTLSTATLFLTDSDSHGQRGGHGGAGRGAAISGARGGAVVGPYGGAGAGARQTNTVIGPARTTTTGSARGSYTAPGGATINYGGVGGKTTGPGGVTAGRGVGGVQVTGPGGQTATKVGAAGGVRGPGGNAIGTKGSIGATTGPHGTAASASRGGAVIGPGGAAVGGTRVGVGTGPGGTVVGASRGGVAAGPYGLGRYSSTAVVGHRTTYIRPGTLPVHGAQVRRNFVHYNSFSTTWYRAHPNAWRAAAWTGAAFWTGVTWRSLASTCGYPIQPLIIDYGTTVVYEGNQVVYNGEPIATTEQYAQQATDLAVQGLEAKPPEKEDWLSLGVFGMIQGDETDANNIFQLAINKEGIIRGNYYNALSDTSVPVFGSVDRKTQRAAWIVGERKDTVYETGVGNLTEPESTMLVHFGKERTQQWMLVRLEQPKE